MARPLDGTLPDIMPLCVVPCLLDRIELGRISRQDGVRHGSGRHGRLCRGYQGCNRELIGLCSTEKVNGLEG